MGRTRCIAKPGPKPRRSTRSPGYVRSTCQTFVLRDFVPRTQPEDLPVFAVAVPVVLFLLAEL
jgi:hypothetical protein